MTDVLAVSSGELSFLIDPERAGRVVQITFSGLPLLTGPDAHPDNWGATFWTSPQADWGWPPVAAVDRAPYALKNVGLSEVELRSPLVTIGAREFYIEKHFRAVPGNCVDTTYVIESACREPFRMAAWEISRVGPGGLTFFPTGTQAVTPIAPHGALEVQQSGGVSFYDHANFQLGRSLKLHADGEEGFLAHLTEDVLLLKIFRNTSADEQAPGEGEVELFANECGRYVEVEVQGPYLTVNPGERTSFRVRTHVSPVSDAARSHRSSIVQLARELRLRYAEDDG